MLMMVSNIIYSLLWPKLVVISARRLSLSQVADYITKAVTTLA